MAHWPTFDALIRYYLAEGFIYVETGCAICRHVQRVLVFPDARVVECTNCGAMASNVIRDIYGQPQ